jgi:hypothetical protein
MSRAEVDRFVADVKGSTRLQTELRKRGSGVAAVAEIARSHFYEITIDDVRDYVRTQERDLTEQELDAVIGGILGVIPPRAIVQHYEPTFRVNDRPRSDRRRGRNEDRHAQQPVKTAA